MAKYDPLSVHHFFGLEPGKDIEITTNKSTTLCLQNTEFQPECVYKKSVYEIDGIYLKQGHCHKSRALVKM